MAKSGVEGIWVSQVPSMLNYCGTPQGHFLQILAQTHWHCSPLRLNHLVARLDSVLPHHSSSIYSRLLDATLVPHIVDCLWYQLRRERCVSPQWVFLTRRLGMEAFEPLYKR